MITTLLMKKPHGIHIISNS